MDTINAIINLVPPKLRVPLAILGILSPFLTRAAYAISAGAGWRGVIGALFFGTNAPKPPAQPDPKTLPPGIYPPADSSHPGSSGFSILPVLLMLVLFAVLWLCAGCAYVRSTTARTTTYDRNFCGFTFNTNSAGKTCFAQAPVPTVVKEKTTVTGYAMLEANQSLAKLKNGSGVSTVGSNSYSAGTYFSGLNENATSTNAAATIDALTRLISKIAPGGF